VVTLDATVDFFEGYVTARSVSPYWRSFEMLLAAMRGRRLRAPFAGALALSPHGVDRSTKGIDVLVHPEDKDRLLALLARDFAITEDLDTLVVLTDRKGTTEVDLLVAYDGISLEACTSPTPASVRGRKVKVVPVDLLAAMKVIAAVDNPAIELKQGADLELLLRAGKLRVNEISARLRESVGVEYARYFMARVQSVETHPARMAPERRT
jgi:hypothetical protein